MTAKKTKRKRSVAEKEPADSRTVDTAEEDGEPDEKPEVTTPPGDQDATEKEPDAEPRKADPEVLLRETGEKLLRTKAEFENYRKRVQREFADIREQTKIRVIDEFLTVYDHFQMALSHAESDDVQSLRQGMEMIQAEFERTLANLGAEPIDAVGQPFDPEAHEAIAQEPSEEVEEGHVLRQWKAGFRVGERLLRPATVVVSGGAPATSAEETAG